MSSTVGLIVGSGLPYWDLPVLAEPPAQTPFGDASSPVLATTIAGRPVLCIARHGPQHTIAPQDVNYRANIWALYTAGVRWCVGINVVGAIARGFLPGELAVPDQLIDYTSGRAATFVGAGSAVRHTEFTEPFDPVLRGRIATAIAACGYAPRRGVYGVTQGPRLETAAEIDRLERDGCAMVGMTAMPEAVLARELRMNYAICAAAVNYAAGRAPTGASIHAQLEQYASIGMVRIAEVLEVVVPQLHDAPM
jgi:purine nucleoside phosphorylase